MQHLPPPSPLCLPLGLVHFVLLLANFHLHWLQTDLLTISKLVLVKFSAPLRPICSRQRARHCWEGQGRRHTRHVQQEPPQCTGGGIWPWLKSIWGMINSRGEARWGADTVKVEGKVYVEKLYAPTMRWAGARAQLTRASLTRSASMKVGESGRFSLCVC